MKNAKHIVDKESNKVYPNFNNQLLYVETKLSSSDLKELKDKVKICLETQDKFPKANEYLAGNMEKEFHLDESFNEIIFPYSSSAAAEYEYFYNKIKDELNQTNTVKKSSSWVPTITWINIQKKHEFNPLHDHVGTYSFVLYIQIPYSLKEELEFQNCKNSNKQLNSLFCFTYLDQYGKICEYPLFIDKTWEGTLILFRSDMMHTVYPFFTSDDYRISISGNLIKKEYSRRQNPQRPSSSQKTFSYG